MSCNRLKAIIFLGIIINMLNSVNTYKVNKKAKQHWLFLQILLIAILFISTVLYICPLKYVQVWEHPGAYYNVFQSINGEYQWILITSICLNIVYVVYSCFSFMKFRMNGKQTVRIFNLVLFVICIIFIILTFIFAFIYSNNYPKG